MTVNVFKWLSCFIVIFIGSFNSGHAQEYSNKEIRAVLKNTVETVDAIHSLKYTLKYYNLSSHDFKSIDRDSIYKSVVCILKIDKSDEIGTLFNLDISYNDTARKTVIYNGQNIYNYFKSGNTEKEDYVDVKNRGYSFITSSDVRGLLYPNIVDELRGLNSIFAKILTDKLEMRSVIYEDRSCYEISIFFKNIFNKNSMKDVVNTFYIDKTTGLPLLFKFEGEWEGLKSREVFEIQYGAINLELEEDVFNVDYDVEVSKLDEGIVKKEVIEPENEFHLNELINGKLLLSNGDSIVLSQQKGKVIILDFWYRRCPPCIKLMPELNKLYELYQMDEILIVGINDFDSKESVNQYFSFKEYNYLSSYKTSQNFSEIVGVSAFPTTVVIDTEGEIIEVFTGYSRNFYKEVSKILKKEIKG